MFATLAIGYERCLWTKTTVWIKESNKKRKLRIFFPPPFRSEGRDPELPVPLIALPPDHPLSALAAGRCCTGGYPDVIKPLIRFNH